MHVVIAGGGFAGKCLALMLVRASRSIQVSIVESDSALESADGRKGIPQMWHTHQINKVGLGMLTELIPGFEGELAARKLQPVNWGTQDVLVFNHSKTGQLPQNYNLGITTWNFSRYLLEQLLLQEVAKEGRISLIKGMRVQNVLYSQDNIAMAVVCKDTDTDADIEHTLQADYVVIAVGNIAIAQLAKMTNLDIPEEVVHAKLGYYSAIFNDLALPVGVKLVGADDLPPEFNCAGVISQIEGGKHIVTLFQYPKIDGIPNLTPASFFRLGHAINPRFGKILESGDLSGEILQYKGSRNVRRMLWNVSDFPGRLAIIGSSFASFNPRFGEGMGTALKQAHVLCGAILQNMPTSQLLGVLRSTTTDPWLMATLFDWWYKMLFEKATPPFQYRLLISIVNRLMRIKDQQTYDSVQMELIKLSHGEGSYMKLLTPQVVLEVLKV